MSDKPQITVAQLLELLRTCPPDALVQIEGCDCIGDAAGVDPPEPNNPDDNSVVIRRTDSTLDW